jgi:tetratricopeptide (TPR) repeat protein
LFVARQSCHTFASIVLERNFAASTTPLLRTLLRVLRRLVLLVFVLLAACRREPPAPIILISIDTLRADHLPVYGYRGIRTPHLDALAHDGIVFRDAWSHVPLTLPSHLSIFTGLLPPEHGVRDNAGYRFDPQRHPTIATLLRRHGYATGAAVSAYVLREGSGLSAGFDEYDGAIGIVSDAPLSALQRDGAVTEKIAERWIARHEQEPFFYFLHLYEPHAPYVPSYDGEIVRSDAIVGALLSYLRNRGLYDRATIVLLSDHGEGLSDHGESGHGVFLYREALQVPLIVKLPHQRRRGESVAQRVSLTAVFGTILHAAGVETAAASLFEPTREPIYAESLYGRIHFGWSELRSVVEGGHQYIESPHAELYDLAADPDEKVNVLTRSRRTAASLRKALADVSAPFLPPDAVDREERRKLAALGYVSGGDPATGPLPDPKEHIAEAEMLERATSLEAMQALLATHPRWSDLRDRVAAALDARGEHLRAAGVWEEGMAITPHLASRIAISAGYARLAGGDIAAAERDARVAAGGEPAAHLLAGEIALARGDLARAELEAAADGDPSDEVESLFLVARVASARRDCERALALLDRAAGSAAVTHASLPQRFHYVAADCLAHLGRLDAARREFARQIAAEPRYVQAYADLALVERISGRTAESRAALEAMFAAIPTRDTALFAASSSEKWGDKAEAATWRARARVVR